MKINEVMKITGLTKKAINYYKDEGLINPYVNPENNYREYSKEDIDKLIQISVLRQFDVSIKEIRNIINNPNLLKEKLEEHLIKINEKAKMLEKRKSVLKECISDFECGTLDEVTAKLSLLNKCLEMDERSREGFMKRQLQKIFPGNFGKMMIGNYILFLNEPIDTVEKEKAWISIVKALDEMDSINYPKEMSPIYKDLSDEDIEKYIKFYEEYHRKWINITEGELLEERKKYIEHIENLNKDTEGNKRFFDLTGNLKKSMASIGFYEGVNKNLKVLSKNYCKYIENLQKFNKLMNFKVDSGKITVE